MIGQSAHHCLAKDPLLSYPLSLRQALSRLAEERQADLYVAGGSVRDWLLGKTPRDLDITVADRAMEFAKALSRKVGGAYVELDADEDVARVVWQGLCLDFSAFRAGSTTIAQDLGLRDFTINALALAVDRKSGCLAEPSLVIDPTGGLSDLDGRLIRVAAPGAFADDPLRLLRAYRFSACLDFTIHPETRAAITAQAHLLTQAAPERIAYELQLIMASGNTHRAVCDMAEAGLLQLLFPELAEGSGLAQPPSHHLDVLAHNLETLRCLEDVIGDPARFFPGFGAHFAAYLAEEPLRRRLKWAALFHDVGKPATHQLRDERITFYNHDQAGAEIFSAIARRLRFSSEDRKAVAKLIGLHMWPFHLSNARLKTGISRKACLKLVKAVEHDLPGMFLLNMADCLAGQGPGKPEGVETHLAELYAEVRQVYEEHIRPVLSRPPLLTGHDLIREFNLAPGPVFREILEELERAQVEDGLAGREQAVAFVADYLRARHCTK